MVLLKEYRVPLPFTMDEYQKGLSFMVSKASKLESKSSSSGFLPMKVIASHEPFENELGKGTFTHRFICLTNRLPEWGRKLFTRSGAELQLEEKSWNAFPYIKTTYTSPLFSPENFEVIVESYHLEDSGTTENALNLPSLKLAIRVVDHVDIAFDAVDPQANKIEEDPTHFRSSKTNRGPLKKGWQHRTKPIMCAYKVVTVNFAIWGLRKKVEKLVHEVIRGTYLVTHRQTFCWIDEWYELTWDEIRALEDEMKETLNTESATLQVFNAKNSPASTWTRLRSRL